MTLKTGLLAASILTPLLLTLGSNPAAAQCLGVGGINTIDSCPSAATPQPGDELLAYQPGQVPHTRKMTIAQLIALTATAVTTLKPTAAPFNAKCDGSTDDTTALTAWAAAITTNTVAALPNSACVFRSPLTFPQVDYVTLRGEGKQSRLLYTGAATTGTIVTIGTLALPVSQCSATGWTIRDLRVMSSTVMTAGDGVLFGHLCESDISNLEIGGDLDGNQNWYNGVHFYGGNTIHLRGYSFSASHDGELVNGDASVQLSDLFQSGGGKIAHAAVGLHIAGNVGGFNIDQTDVLENDTNVLVDQSQVAVANVQLFFGPEMDSDATNSGHGPGAGFIVSDAGGANSQLFFSGTWLASAQVGATGPGGVCLWLKTAVQWKVQMSGGTITNCSADGIRNDSTATTVHVAGTYINQNTGYGINNTSGTNNVITEGAYFKTNTLGNFTANVMAVGFQQYGLFGPDAAQPMYGQTWLMAAAQGQNAATVAGVANGTIGASAAAQWRWVGGTTNSNATMSLDDNNGAPKLALTLGSAVLGFSLPPVLLPAFTVATLPTCNAAAKYKHVAVSDAAAPTYNATLTGGGAVVAEAQCNGTAWTAH